MFTKFLVVSKELNLCIKSNNSTIFSLIEENTEGLSFSENFVFEPTITFFILENQSLLDKCIKIKNRHKKLKFRGNFFLKIKNNNAIVIDKNKKYVYFFYNILSLSKLEYILKILISLINIIQPAQQGFYLKASCVSKNGKGTLILCDDNKYKEKILYLLLENGFDFVAKNLVFINNVSILNKENIITINLKNIFSILNNNLKQKISSSCYFRKKDSNYLDKKVFLTKAKFKDIFEYNIQDNVVLDKIIILKADKKLSLNAVNFICDYDLFNILYNNINKGSLNTFDFLETIQENNNSFLKIPKLYNKINSIQINYNNYKLREIIDIITSM